MCEFRIHIVVPTGIFDLNGLHFMAVWIAIALTMHGHHRTDGDGVLLQAGRGGAGRWRQRDVPNLAVRGHDLHGAVWAGELDSLGDRAGHGGDFIDISAPAVMCKGGNGGCNGNGGGEHDCVRAHDILLSWTGGLCRNPWVTGRLKFYASVFVQWKPAHRAIGPRSRIAVESAARCRTGLGLVSRVTPASFGPAWSFAFVTKWTSGPFAHD